MSLELTSVDSCQGAPQTQGARKGTDASTRLSSMADQARPTDLVEISDEARRASEAPVRQNLVDSVKALIASGDYETPDKIDSAIEALAKELGI